MSDDDLQFVFIPALVAILLNQEQRKGAPLTQEEVLAIRDDAAHMALPRAAAAEMVRQRGHDDIDPENVWEDWTAIRPTLDL